MGLFNKKNSLLGVDLGTDSIKAIEVTKDRDVFRVTGFGQVEVPSPEQRADALSDLLRHCNFKTKRVATSVSGRSVIVRFLNMVDIPDDNLKSAIRFEADRYIPFDLNEVILDCHRVEGAQGLQSNQMRLLLVAVKRDLVDEQLQLLSAAGLQPEVVDVDAFAMGNVFAHGGSAYEMAAGRVVALVDIGASKTVVNVVCGPESHFTREVYVGGNDFTSAITKRFAVEPFEAEQLKRSPGNREAEVTEALVPNYEDLGNEIQLSFDYYENQSEGKVEDVFISGGGSRVAGLEEVFERIFERRTMAWDPLEALEIDESSVDVEGLADCAPALSVAAGLAIRA